MEIVLTSDIPAGLLSGFERRQSTKYVLRQDGRRQRDEFDEDWQEADRARVEGELREGKALLARENGRLLGFACISGRHGDAEILSYLHVTAPLRGQGIGRALFEAAAEVARQAGAARIYIGAHPSVETQRFYSAMGCVRTDDFIMSVFEAEPRDIQLEYRL